MRGFNSGLIIEKALSRTRVQAVLIWFGLAFLVWFGLAMMMVGSNPGWLLNRLSRPGTRLSRPPPAHQRCCTPRFTIQIQNRFPSTSLTTRHFASHTGSNCLREKTTFWSAKWNKRKLDEVWVIHVRMLGSWQGPACILFLLLLRLAGQLQLPMCKKSKSIVVTLRCDRNSSDFCHFFGARLCCWC